MDAILTSLRRRKIERVCHMAPCDRLPEIFEHGGLLSYRMRQQRGVPESAEPHYWGSANKKDDFADYVVCAFMPPWWMCRGHQEELALILLDAEAICTKPAVRFCPGNSAYNDFPVNEVLASTGPARFEACFPNPNTYQARSAEIFVPDQVPLVDFRGIVFCDAVAHAHWWPQLVAAYTGAAVKAPLPGPLEVFDKRSSDYRFTFPGDYTPSRRVR